MMRMPGPAGALVVVGGRMTRMLGPGGAVVLVGGRMTWMLGLGSPAGSGGMRGSGGRCFSGLAGGGCAPLSSRSLGWDWR